MAERPAPRSGLILSVNAGSSSLKISVYRLSPPGTLGEPVELLIDASLSSITKDATFSFSTADESIKAESCKNEPAKDVKDHSTGFAYFLDHLKQAAGIDREKIVHVCHRIVHGGRYHTPILITEQAYHHIERLSDLAPLQVFVLCYGLSVAYRHFRHNGAALSVIHACIDALPHANSIAYFDTAFHHHIPPHVASYAIDQTIARKKGLRKYGFHGLSCKILLQTPARLTTERP